METVDKIPMDIIRWQLGCSLDEFVAGMKTNQADMRRRLREAELPESDRSYFTRFQSFQSPIHVLVMTEDWCGDSLMNLPILARIVEAAPGMDQRIFVRSESPDLNDYFATRSITHIPVVAFLDAGFNEMGTWVERSQAAHTRVKLWLESHSEFRAIRDDATLTPDEKKARLREMTAGLTAEMEGWYARDLQAATVHELATLLHEKIKTVK
jgi:hypothetical protein